MASKPRSVFLRIIHRIGIASSPLKCSPWWNVAASAFARFYAERVFAVEDPGEAEVAEPAQLAVWLELADGGQEGHCPPIRWL